MRVKQKSERAGLRLNIKKNPKKLRSCIWPHHCMAKERENVEGMTDYPFLGSKITVHGDWLEPWNQKTIASWQESNDKPRQCAEKQRHYSTGKGLYHQGYGVPSSHMWLWELDYKETRMPKNWCLWTVVLEKTPERPLDCKIKSVNLKGVQPWVFAGRTDAEAEAPVFWSSDAHRWLTGKVPDAGKDRGQRRRRHQRMRWLDGITNAMDMNLGKLQRWWGTGRPGVLQYMGSQRVGHDWATEQQQQPKYELLNIGLSTFG